MSLSDYLKYCLDSYSMEHVEKEVKKDKAKSSQISAALEDQFPGWLAGPVFVGGSISKGTAINANYDIDVILPFKHGIFSDGREMMSQVENFFENEFEADNYREMRPQRFSIGLYFKNFWGVESWIDIVPGIEQHSNSYKKDGYLQIFDSKNGNPVLTNIKLQQKHLLAGHPNAKDIVKLFKVIKTEFEDFALKSFVIEMLVIRALESLPQNFNNLELQFLHVVRFIKENIQFEMLIDPGNPRNDVSNLLTPSEKRQISLMMQALQQAITSHDRKLISEFLPENKAYSW